MTALFYATAESFAQVYPSELNSSLRNVFLIASECLSVTLKPVRLPVSQSGSSLCLLETSFIFTQAQTSSTHYKPSNILIRNVS